MRMHIYSTSRMPTDSCQFSCMFAAIVTNCWNLPCRPHTHDPACMHHIVICAMLQICIMWWMPILAHVGTPLNSVSHCSNGVMEMTRGVRSQLQGLIRYACFGPHTKHVLSIYRCGLFFAFTSQVGKCLVLSDVQFNLHSGICSIACEAVAPNSDPP